MKFGTAGIPFDSENTIDGIKKVREMNLDAMELEFVYGVYLSKEEAAKVNKTAKREGITLTAHAPYFINLNSKEKAKVEASKKRILQSAKIAHLAGAKSVVFHPGFYLGQDSKIVYGKIKEEIKKIINKLKEENVNILLRPETTGKLTQFGTINELLKLSIELEDVMPCIDFAHIHARTQKYNSYEEFSQILSLVEKHLGKEGLRNMHIHISGINYNGKGERNHLNLKYSDFNYRALLKALKDFKADGIIICESPNNGIVGGDTQLLKKEWKRLSLM
ncbi:MAG: TIM barrel protein [Nanoarchaeota archaeon]|nr:TIM barrel protein [Nanoarchaeota archaeon]